MILQDKRKFLDQSRKRMKLQARGNIPIIPSASQRRNYELHWGAISAFLATMSENFFTSMILREKRKVEESSWPVEEGKFEKPLPGDCWDVSFRDVPGFNKAIYSGFFFFRFYSLSKQFIRVVFLWDPYLIINTNGQETTLKVSVMFLSLICFQLTSKAIKLFCINIFNFRYHESQLFWGFLLLLSTGT